MGRLVEALEGTVERVEVTRVEGGTFYAEVTLFTPHGLRMIDARPSDAIALASRLGAPIWVADSVFAAAGGPESLTAPTAEAAEGETVAKFRRDLDAADPDAINHLPDSLPKAGRAPNGGTMNRGAEWRRKRA